MYCPNCNKTFPDNHAFCDNCGGKLVEQAPQAQPSNTGYQAPSHMPNPQPAHSAPAYPAQAVPHKNETVSFGAWFGISILNIVPFFIGLVAVIGIVLTTVLQVVNGSFDFSSVSPVSLVFIILTVLYVIMLFIWAFGGARKHTLRNYARATLLMSLILVALTVVAYFVFRDSIADTVTNLNDIMSNFEISY